MAQVDVLAFQQGLEIFPAALQVQAHTLRNMIWERYPEANELIYIKDKYLAVGWSLGDKQTDIFVSFAVYSKYINLGFNFGDRIPDPQGLLQGSGNMYRYFRITNMEEFPMAEMLRFMDEGWTVAHGKWKPGKVVLKGQTILKQNTRKSASSSVNDGQ